MSDDQSSREVHWLRTVGGPRPGDQRDGELHQFFGDLPDHFDLESWDDEADDDARYVRDPGAQPTEEDGRTVWNYHYQT